MALTKEDLQAIRALMQEENAPIISRLNALETGQRAMQADIEQIKEDTAITREATNALGEWAEIASVVLKVEYPVRKG